MRQEMSVPAQTELVPMLLPATNAVRIVPMLGKLVSSLCSSISVRTLLVKVSEVHVHIHVYTSIYRKALWQPQYISHADTHLSTFSSMYRSSTSAIIVQVNHETYL